MGNLLSQYGHVEIMGPNPECLPQALGEFAQTDHGKDYVDAMESSFNFMVDKGMEPEQALVMVAMGKVVRDEQGNIPEAAVRQESEVAKKK